MAHVCRVLLETHRIDQARGGFRVQGGAGYREPVPEDAVDLVGEQFQVGVGGEFAAGASAVEDAMQGGAAVAGEGGEQFRCRGVGSWNVRMLGTDLLTVRIDLN
ncbi:hypothetical protein AWN90_28890 [Nocardia terpenica]|uniref:Uncharacterized protein n=1 Tax=Nocardia terpenica TaxID=455432 RepID=A0A164LVL1_9NOCA|nr:hypothetical protein [Nocardia terpenica]KZM72789.1 hypothetical protein AWN90_28890 [Nocardia terpenica]